jgi:hypothetical protein
MSNQVMTQIEKAFMETFQAEIWLYVDSRGNCGVGCCPDDAKENYSEIYDDAFAFANGLRFVHCTISGPLVLALLEKNSMVISISNTESTDFSTINLTMESKS